MSPHFKHRIPLITSLWTAYPIVWALSEGTNKISVNTEIIAYGVLDV